MKRLENATFLPAVALLERGVEVVAQGLGLALQRQALKPPAPPQPSSSRAAPNLWSPTGPGAAALGSVASSIPCRPQETSLEGRPRYRIISLCSRYATYISLYNIIEIVYI